MEAQYQTHYSDKSAAILGVISGLYSSSVSIALIHVTSVIWNETALYYSVVAELIPSNMWKSLQNRDRLVIHLLWIFVQKLCFIFKSFGQNIDKVNKSMC